MIATIYDKDVICFQDILNMIFTTVLNMDDTPDCEKTLSLLLQLYVIQKANELEDKGKDIQLINGRDAEKLLVDTYKKHRVYLSSEICCVDDFEYSHDEVQNVIYDEHCTKGMIKSIAKLLAQTDKRGQDDCRREAIERGLV